MMAGQPHTRTLQLWHEVPHATGETTSVTELTSTTKQNEMPSVPVDVSEQSAYRDETAEDGIRDSVGRLFGCPAPPEP